MGKQKAAFWREGNFLRYTGRTGLAFFPGQLEVEGRGESPECGLWEYHLDS